MKASGGLQRDSTGTPFADRFRSSPSPSKASPFFSNYERGMITITKSVMPLLHSKMSVLRVTEGKKKGQNKLYLVTLFLGSTTVKGFFAGPSRRGLPFILFFLFLHKIVHNRVMLWLQCS